MRRLVAAVLAAAAVLAVGRLALARPAPGTEPVVVAVGPVAVGTTLTPALLEVRHLARDAIPEGAVRDVGSASGRAASSVLVPGEVVTASDLGGSSLLTDQPGGTRGVFLPVPEPPLLAALRGGDRVDVRSPVDGSRVVEDALVLAVHAGEDGGLWLAVTDDGAGALAAARGADPAGGSLLVSLRN
ncbi:hypothetical protein GCM10011366_02590 [Ornithinimicrobium tianjinense]|uniref:SAF domain-containing protein n=1 Tax=Ornithinimicrobium tianjinense TaxID=1195761 RepID=A0A917BDP5_9MICO|nr:hypothetical protein GCM10011366_02590 [Ornithinimicrobium tianjinense]